MSIAQHYMKNHFKGKIIGEGDQRVFVGSKGIGEYVKPVAERRYGRDTMAAQRRAGTELENLIGTSNKTGHNTYDKRHPEYPGEFDLFQTVFGFRKPNGELLLFEGEITAGIDKQNRREFYGMAKTKQIDSSDWVKQHGNAAAQNRNRSDDQNIAEKENNVKLSLADVEPADTGMDALVAENASLKQTVEALQQELAAWHKGTADHTFSNTAMRDLARRIKNEY